MQGGVWKGNGPWPRPWQDSKMITRGWWNKERVQQWGLGVHMFQRVESLLEVIKLLQTHSFCPFNVVTPISFLSYKLTYAFVIHPQICLSIRLLSIHPPAHLPPIYAFIHPLPPTHISPAIHSSFYFLSSTHLSIHPSLLSIYLSTHYPFRYPPSSIHLYTYLSVYWPITICTLPSIYSSICYPYVYI